MVKDKSTSLSASSSRCCLFRIVKGHTLIIFISLLLFVVLAGSGIALYSVFSQSSEHRVYHVAYDLAVERVSWLAKEIDVAILPLYSMAQFALELDRLSDLPDQIGPAGHAAGSLPFVNRSVSDVVDAQRAGTLWSLPRHRNVSGVCDNVELVEQFTKIAAEMKKRSDEDDGILHSIQLAPFGVICLAYPLNNTQDFDNGQYLDNTPILGLDLLASSSSSSSLDGGSSLEAALMTDAVHISKPQTLMQCPNCGNYFVARLPIVSASPRHNITLGNDHELYHRWGFATVLINWDKLLQRSNLHQIFREQGFEFRLSRSDGNSTSSSTDSDNTDPTILTESKGYGSKTSTLTYPLHTSNSHWTITVHYDDPRSHAIIVICITILCSFCIAFLVGMVLVQKQSHSHMIAMVTTQNAKVDVERNMTAYFAHELRNPLSAIDSALQSISYNDVAEPAHDLISSMRLCSGLMSSIMNNLLDVRKMEEGKLILHADPFSLGQMVYDARTMALPTMSPGVRLVADVDTLEHGDWVLGDEPRIQQVLTNLLSNAIKYTKRGSVTIAVCWTDNENVCIECRDTGPGIPKEDQAHMFERFTQRGGAPGSGLGLAIAKQVVTLMGGTIQFISDPTVRPGTTCRVLLPLEPCSDPQESVSMPAELEPIDDPISILVIDDLSMNRAMLKRRLQKGIAPDCEVTEAVNGEQALTICAQRSFDVIIVDQFMEEAGGVMVGTDVIIAMRRNKVTSLIVGCSGNDLDAKFIAAGADLIWKKPMPSNQEIIRQFRNGLHIR